MSGKTYDVGGKFLKQCPSCKKYCHARCGLCPGCEHEFIAGAAVKAAVKVADNETITKYDKPGHGKKLCPTCTSTKGTSVYVGCRIGKCDCGYDFVAAKAAEPELIKDKSRIEAEELMAGMGYEGMKIMYIPNGDPPIAMKDYDENSIFEWCEDVVTHYWRLGYFAAPDCIRWLARHLAPADNIKSVLLFIKAWQAQYTPEAELV